MTEIPGDDGTFDGEDEGGYDPWPEPDPFPTMPGEPDPFPTEPHE